MKNIEIVEIGYPQSIIKRENEPISLIGTECLVSQLQTRINELEGTIENMKAISFPKEEVVNGITSVDYPSDNETEINVFIPIEINYWKGKSTHIYRKSFSTIEECQAFFDNMHKEDSGERWGTMLCDYRTAKWEYKENGDLLMMVNHDGAIVEYICMNCGRKIKK